jgi:hypothetical protein
MEGPTTVAVDRSLRLTASVDGAEQWVWIGPDGAVAAPGEAVDIPGRDPPVLSLLVGELLALLRRREISDECVVGVRNLDRCPPTRWRRPWRSGMRWRRGERWLWAWGLLTVSPPRSA